MAKQDNHSNRKLVGHQSQRKFLEQIISSGKIPHAFIFTGARGIGKSLVAYDFAKMILSIGATNKPVKKKEPVADEFDLFGETEKKEEVAEFIPVINQIISDKIDNHNHSDLYLLKKQDDTDKKNIGIEEVRGIGKFISLTPSEGQYRVALIDSIDDFNFNSLNAILKILEEPTKNTVLIIICHNKAALLPTIKSRCLELKFDSLSITDFSNAMKGHETDNLDELYDLSQGSPGFALDIINTDAAKTVKKFITISNDNNINITSISQLSKEIKDNDSWSVFGNLYLKSELDKLKSKKDLTDKDLNRWDELNKIISYSDIRNMDIQDALKTLISIIK